jgi:hypothetical protein
MRHVCMSVCLGDLCCQRLGSPYHVSTQHLDAGVGRFGKGPARIGTAARTQGRGLAVLAQHEGCPPAGAVGRQARGGQGTRGLGQVKGVCRRAQALLSTIDRVCPDNYYTLRQARPHEAGRRDSVPSRGAHGEDQDLWSSTMCVCHASYVWSTP